MDAWDRVQDGFALLPIKIGGKALVVEGGGMRGAFAGGVLAAMAIHYPPENFDLVLGVSAGACAAAFYCTDMNADQSMVHRLMNMWRYEIAGRKFITLGNWFKGRAFMNLEYLIEELFQRKYKLNHAALDNPGHTPLYVALTNLRTQKTEFLRADGGNLYELLRAATSLPLATRGSRRIGDVVYTDSAVLNPLPIQAVIDAGYTDITVILNNPRDYRMKQMNRFVARLLYPLRGSMARVVGRTRALNFNRAYELAQDPPRGVKIHVIDPSRRLMKLTDTSEALLNRSVDMGLEAGLRAFAAMRRKRGFFHRLARLFVAAAK